MIKTTDRQLVGQRFGKLVVVSKSDRGGAAVYWNCLCDCGSMSITNGRHLVPGAFQKCRCKVREKHRKRLSKHNWFGTPTHLVWTNMRNRCKYPCVKAFKHYGGRGIKVCDRWSDFANFLADMGERPTPKHTLDRIDNDGNYEPSNCRWILHQEQMNNRRGNTFLTHSNQTMTVAQWARAVGIDKNLIYNRLGKGWPIERALTEPVGLYFANQKRKPTEATTPIERTTCQ